MIFSKTNWRFAAIKNGMKDAIAYPSEFFIGLISSAIVPAGMQFILWHSIFRSSGATSFAGMNYSELLAYTWTTLLFSQIRGGNQDFDLIEKIRTGDLNNYLLRPVGVIEFIYMRSLGEKLLVTFLCLGLGLIATLFTPLQAVNLFLGMLLAIVGNVILYMMGATLASVAFYWENAFSILMVKNMLVSLLSGELLPLSLFPEQYSWIWKSTPFYLFVYGPAQMTLGKWSIHEWLFQMTIGFAWIFFFWLAIKISWGFSIKRYQGLGG